MNAATYDEFIAHLNRYQNAVLPTLMENGAEYSFVDLVRQLWNLIDGARVRRVIMTEIVWLVGLNNMGNAVDAGAHNAHLAWVGQQQFNNHSAEYIRQFKALVNAATDAQKLVMYAILAGLRIDNEEMNDAENIQLIYNNGPNLNNPAFINYLNNMNNHMINDNINGL